MKPPIIPASFTILYRPSLILHLEPMLLECLFQLLKGKFLSKLTVQEVNDEVLLISGQLYVQFLQQPNQRVDLNKIIVGVSLEPV